MTGVIPAQARQLHPAQVKGLQPAVRGLDKNERQADRLDLQRDSGDRGQELQPHRFVRGDQGPITAPKEGGKLARYVQDGHVVPTPKILWSDGDGERSRAVRG